MWEMDTLVKIPLNEKTVSSPQSVVSEIPRYTDKKLAIDFVFTAKQGKIDGLMKELGYNNIPVSIMKSIALTIKNITAGKQPLEFPPASKHYLNGKNQDLTYGKIEKNQRLEFYIWRLPYRTKQYIPVWAAGFSDNLKKKQKKSDFKKSLKTLSNPKNIKAYYPTDKKEILLIEINNQ